jgi:hypothetical protein
MKYKLIIIKMEIVIMHLYYFLQGIISTGLHSLNFECEHKVKLSFNVINIWIFINSTFCIFFEMEHSPRLCIRWCTQQFITKFKNSKYYNHGSAKVETCINQQNSKSNKWLSILKSTNMSSSSSLEIEVLCDRQQPVAPNNHRLPLILREK